MFKTPQRHFLKVKDVKEILLDFTNKFGVDARLFFGSNPKIESAVTKDIEILLIDGRPLLARVHEVLVPTLFFDEFLSLIPRIVVNMGAVPHVCNGAHVMAPGIVRICGNFNVGDLLLVVDERNEKPLAVGFALFNSHTMRGLKHGRVLENVHHVLDKLWNLVKSLRVKKV